MSSSETKKYTHACDHCKEEFECLERWKGTDDTYYCSCRQWIKQFDPKKIWTSFSNTAVHSEQDQKEAALKLKQAKEDGITAVLCFYCCDECDDDENQDSSSEEEEGWEELFE